jgi:COP9 signalosome complex subunit 1
MSLKLLYVAIILGNWSDAQSNRLKMLGFTPKDDTAPSYDAVLVSAGGLIALNMGNYREAADMFLKVHPTYMHLQPLAGVKFDRVLTPNDIAIYGGLCALATMDADELRTNILENQPFRQFLELESHLRRAINMFCASKFTSCLAVLDGYAGDYSMDLYLQEHFEALYGMIRAKSLVRWFSAFSVIELAEVKRAFPERRVGEKRVTVEEELEKMISDGKLHARIDLADGVSIFPK